MLQTPENGMTKVYIGQQYVGTATNATNIPVVILDVLLTYFLAQKTNTTFPLVLMMHAKDNLFGIVEFGNDVYIVNSEAHGGGTICGTRISPESMGLPQDASASEMIKAMAEECLQDIIDDYNAWTKFYLRPGREPAAAITDNKNKLANYLFVLDKILTDAGNVPPDKRKKRTINV